MANEFVARNGIIANADSRISGTLDVSGNITMGTALVATRSWVTGTALVGYATESYVNTALANLTDSAPDLLNTLNELAAALGDDPNFATTVTNSIATKVAKAGDTMTGPLRIDTTGTALEITGTTTVDGSDVSIYLGNSPSAYGFYITYVGTGGGNTNAFRIQSTNAGTPKTLLVSNQDGIVNFPTGLQLNGATVATETFVTTRGYLTEESDPIFVGSPAYNIEQTSIDKWDLAFGWGDHAGLYAAASHTHSATDITSGTLASARLSGTYAISVSGSAATLTTARTLTIGSTGKTFNGSANVSWSLAEIGAAAASHTHDDRYYTESESDSLFARKASWNTSSISNAYTRVGRLSAGDELSSAIYLRAEGTNNNIVVNALFTILVNHSQDIVVESISGQYTQCTLKIQSDNNENFDIYFKVESTASTPTINFTLYNLEDGLTFTANPTDTAYTGNIVEHTTVSGGKRITSSGGSTARIYLEGDKVATESYVASNYSASTHNHDSVYLKLSGTTSALNMNNQNIININSINIGDPGPGEGINFGGAWSIWDSPNDLTTNAGGNLQFVRSGVRVMTLDTSNNLYLAGGITALGYNNTNWDAAYAWGNNYISSVSLDGSNLRFTGEGSGFTGDIDLSTLGYLTSYSETDTLATVTARGNTTTGSINVNGNILLTGTATTTNQGRMIDFTGFDKEGTTDFSDRAYIQHTVNAGGHSGSVLVISSQNDSGDGIAFLTNASSKLKHNSNNIATEPWVTSQGYLTSFTESDPVFAASDAAGITAGMIAKWDDAFSWGNHANAGYLTTYTETDTLASVTARGATTSNKVFFTHNTTADPLSAVEINGGGNHTGLYINPAASKQAHVRFGTNGTLKWQIRAPFQDSVDTALKFYSWVSGDDKFVFNHNGSATFNGGTVWTSANDGAGSGLDADLLDGINSGSFLRSDAADTFTGILTGTATGENLKIGGIRGTTKGSQTGEYIHLYERVHIGGPSGWGAASHGAPSYGLSTWGSVDFGMNGTGVIQLDGTTIVTAARALTNVTNTNWDAAYSWGNHAGLYDTVGSADAVNQRIDNEVLPAIPTDNSQLANGAGYITDGNTGWNNSYGFITASSTDTLTNKSGNISQWTNNSGYITASSSITGTSAGVVRTVTGTSSAELVRGNMGDNDQARILVGATASNAGYLEIATADDGTEPIYVRQYTGVFSSLTRTATLLDGSGNTSFPGTVTAPTFSGGLSGNASTASKWATARTITLGGDLSGSVSIDGSANVTLSAEVANDSHTHDGRYYTESESDARFVNVTGDTVTGNLVVSGASLGVISTSQGSEAFYVDGVNGRLFTINDDLSDSLFSVNTISGLPVIEAFADNRVNIGPFSNPVTVDTAGLLYIGGLQAATQSYVDTAITNLIGGAPGALDTLNELAAAIADDASYATTITNALATKAPLASPALTGVPTAPTAATATNTTQIATTAFVKAQGYLTSLGFNYGTSVTANFVVQRDANGYIYGNHINLSSSETENPTINSFFVSNGDGWTRKASVAHVKSQLGLGSAAYTASTAYAAASHAHDASDISSGVLAAERIPDLSGTYSVAGHTHAAGDITSGTFAAARIPDLSGTYATASHNHTSLTGITSLGFSAQSSDSASITTTISGTSTFFDFNLTDDNNNDWWRWRFTPSGSTVYDAMTLKPLSNGNADLTVSGSIFADNFSGSSSGTNTGDQTTISGNAGSATVLQTARTLTIGSTGKNFNGSANVSWSLAEIGAQPAGSYASASHTHTIGDISDRQRLFNNMGNNHSTFTDFNSVSNFGPFFIQGTAGGPETGSSQYYGLALGLGNDYAYGSYAMQMAIPRYEEDDKYLTFRTRENGTWSEWVKFNAGYADSAGSLTSMNISQFTNNSGYITGYTETDTLATVIGRGAYFGTTNQGYVTANAGTYGSEIRKIRRITMTAGSSNWDNDNHCIISTDSAGNLADSLSLNSYNDITLRVDTNSNNNVSYVRFGNHGTGSATYWFISGYDGARYLTTHKGDFLPGDDRTYNIGQEDQRWRIVFCETLDSAGLHETNLETEGAEELQTGTVLVWKGGKNVPCSIEADHMRMGIAVHGHKAPLVQGAEPVLCTGEVNEGDYLITSTTTGHAKAVNRAYVVENQLFDCVLGKALETASGESHLVKTWITI